MSAPSERRKIQKISPSAHLDNYGIQNWGNISLLFSFTSCLIMLKRIFAVYKVRLGTLWPKIISLKNFIILSRHHKPSEWLLVQSKVCYIWVGVSVLVEVSWDIFKISSFFLGFHIWLYHRKIHYNCLCSIFYNRSIKSPSSLPHSYNSIILFVM